LEGERDQAAPPGGSMTDTGLHNEGAGMPRARFVAFAVNGRRGYGLLRDDGLADLSRRLADTAPTLQSLIASGEIGRAARWARGCEYVKDMGGAVDIKKK